MATQPGGPIAATATSANVGAHVVSEAVERYQPDTALAMDAMSDCNGAS